MSTSFNGWPVFMNYPAAEFVAPGGKHVYCASRDVATIFEYIARRWHTEIEPIAKSNPANLKKPRERHSTIPGGGYDMIGIHCYRPPNTNVGTGNQSNHRSATGMDINGHLHPYEATMSGPWYSGFTAKQTATLRAIANSVRDNNGRVLIRLGLDFAVGKRDGMHVEIAPSVSAAQVSQAAARIRLSKPIEVIEDLAAEVIDSLELLDFPGSTEGVKEFQRKHNLTVDGIVGPITSARLEVEVSKALDAAVKAINDHTTQRTAVTMNNITADAVGSSKGGQKISLDEAVDLTLRRAAQGFNEAQAARQAIGQIGSGSGGDTGVVEQLLKHRLTFAAHTAAGKMWPNGITVEGALSYAAFAVKHFEADYEGTDPLPGTPPRHTPNEEG